MLSTRLSIRIVCTTWRVISRGRVSGTPLVTFDVGDGMVESDMGSFSAASKNWMAASSEEAEISPGWPWCLPETSMQTEWSTSARHWPNIVLQARFFSPEISIGMMISQMELEHSRPTDTTWVRTLTGTCCTTVGRTATACWFLAKSSSRMCLTTMQRWLDLGSDRERHDTSCHHMSGIIRKVAGWTNDLGLTLINYTPGTRSPRRLHDTGYGPLRIE